MMRLLGTIALFLFLTAITQIGGIILLMSLLLRRWFGALAMVASFPVLYLIGTFFLVPPLASAISGRVPLPCSGPASLQSASPLYCLLNRNYVTPRLFDLAQALSRSTEDAFPGTVTRTLDGNFPFFDGFPLLPHLSHDDGRKLDLAFHYEGGGLRSPIGYFAFQKPLPGDPQICPDQPILSLRWDLDWLQPVFPKLPIDIERQRMVIDWLTNEGKQYGLEKVFIEPHLTARLNVSDPTIRFQGCRAARHDDHLHIQLAD
ncbi:hypothetical protein B7H23_08915 [Notoacmeibacter marinus]|uniref:Penicillin-insensitive murein endopeptidase n=1 Tax=Notoacmeibacter marinus TaxID=1876515 RepID=A0A231UWM1_9HYPH|nr:hypothetical protein [Notoacmeibacter marinus]OXT00272.1 hypothetical protein B7H23_08915 [Notoacmeibacter marinus]